MICSLINQKKVSQGCVKAPGEEGRPGSVSGSPCLSPWPNRCSLSRRLRPPPRTPKHVHWAAAIPQAPMTRACAWIAQQIEDEACVARPSPACSGIAAARQGRGAPRRRESGEKARVSLPPSGVGERAGDWAAAGGPGAGRLAEPPWGGPLQRGSAEPWGSAGSSQHCSASRVSLGRGPWRAPAAFGRLGPV